MSIEIMYLFNCLIYSYLLYTICKAHLKKLAHIPDIIQIKVTHGISQPIKPVIIDNLIIFNLLN